VKLETRVVGITAGSREVPGRNACDRRHTYRIIIIIKIIIGKFGTVPKEKMKKQGNAWTVHYKYR